MIRNAIGPRGRRIVATGSWSLVAKGCAAAHLFLSVPFVLQALGPPEFGAWVTLVAVVSLAGFLDFGMANGAMNLIAQARGRRTDGEVAAIFFEARAVLIRTAMLLAIPATVLVIVIPWHSLLGLPETSSERSRTAVAIIAGTVLLSAPLNLATRAQLGIGRGEQAFRWQALGQIAALTTVVIAAKMGAGLATLTAASVCLPALASFANNLQLSRDPGFRKQSGVTSDRASLRRSIRAEGLAFFGLQLSAALAVTADLPLITSLVSSEAAGTYAIAQRLFSTIPLCLSLVWAPLWPIYRHALASGDLAWVARTLRRSLIVAVAFATLAATVLCISFDYIVGLWIQVPLYYSIALIVGMGVWCIVDAAGTAISTFLNAASVLRYQLATAVAFSIISLVGKVALLTRGHVELMPWITVTAYTVCCLLPLAWYGKRFLPWKT